MAEEEKVKISALNTARRNALSGGYIPVAVPNEQTFKMPIEDLTDPAEIALAAYGETEFAAVSAALAADKVVFASRIVDSVKRIAALTDFSATAFHFVWYKPDGTGQTWELTSNGWTSSDIAPPEPEPFEGVETDGETITGDGKNTPLSVNTEALEVAVGEEIEQAVDAIRTKIVYSLDLGCVSAGQSLGSNGYGIYGTIFNPPMNQPLDPENTKLIFAMNQSEGGQASDIENKTAFFAIYRYDILDNTIHWVANTDNLISQMGGPNYVHGRKVAALNHIATDQETEAPEELQSTKLYYLVLITNCSGCKIIGNTKSENFNVVPYVAFKIDNAKFNDGTTSITKDNLTGANLGTNLATLTPEGEINMRLFAAITNAQLSNNE